MCSLFCRPFVISYRTILTGPISVVKELAKCVDLNTLDALSRTCRQFRANLLVFRHQLIKLTLRCENEYILTVSKKLLSGESIPDNLKYMLQYVTQESANWALFTSNKGGKCARDMVQECRRCSQIVCRVSVKALSFFYLLSHVIKPSHPYLSTKERTTCRIVLLNHRATRG
jgi:hypothetical protein